MLTDDFLKIDCLFCYIYGPTVLAISRPLRGKKATLAIKSPCQFGCVGYLALAELLLIFLYLSIYKGKNTFTLPIL